jgi:carotenoid 1,2-hydratase
MVSEDGRIALTAIIFVGSVFSPYYARQRHRASREALSAGRPSSAATPLAAASAEQHCAVNLAIYDRTSPRWVFTESPAQALRRDPSSLAIGRSTLRWEGDALVLDIDELTSPIGVGRRVRGRVTLHPEVMPATVVHLDPRGRHRWQPIAPVARAEASFEAPSLRFRGSAYHDANWGDEPLEAAFRRWDWSRAELGAARGAGRAHLLYDAELRDGTAIDRAFEADTHGLHEHTHEGSPRAREGLTRAVLPPTPVFRMPRATRVDVSAAGREGAAQVLRTLEDTPFYSRSILKTRLRGEEVVSVHESLDLDRFTSRVVQLMLRFRMRRARRSA